MFAVRQPLGPTEIVSLADHSFSIVRIAPRREIATNVLTRGGSLRVAFHYDEFL
jgi:hypothetical protein